jgi:hypothetical protein
MKVMDYLERLPSRNLQDSSNQKDEAEQLRSSEVSDSAAEHTGSSLKKSAAN